MTDVHLEVGRKRTFAVACDWPGWARSGKDEAAALSALAAYAPRYEATIGVEVDPTFVVVERVAGSASTDFGAIDRVPERDRRAFAPGETARLAELLGRCFAAFDRAVAAAPAELRKGPRGGGRDRDAIAAHVSESVTNDARRLGVRATVDVRAALDQAVRAATDPWPTAPKGWPIRTVATRIGWHLLDHTWELEDHAT